MACEAAAGYGSGMKQLVPLVLLLVAAPASAATLADVAASLKGTTSLAADFTQAGADAACWPANCGWRGPGRCVSSMTRRGNKESI